MSLPVAALYDIVIGAHRIAGILMILFAVALTVMPILSRSQEGVLEKADPLVKLAGPLFALVLLTGTYQVIHLKIAFFQVWIVGALLCGIAYIGVLDGLWRRKSKAVLGGGLSAAEDRKARSLLIAAGAVMIVLIFAATYLMENQVG